MNKNMWIRLLCALLAMIMVGITLIACADEKEEEQQEQQGEQTPEETPEEEKEEDPYDIPDSLPEANYGGVEFSILYYNDNQLPYFYIADKTGDLIDYNVPFCSGKKNKAFYSIVEGQTLNNFN